MFSWCNTNATSWCKWIEFTSIVNWISHTVSLRNLLMLIISKLNWNNIKKKMYRFEICFLLWTAFICIDLKWPTIWHKFKLIQLMIVLSEWSVVSLVTVIRFSLNTTCLLFPMHVHVHVTLFSITYEVKLNTTHSFIDSFT